MDRHHLMIVMMNATLACTSQLVLLPRIRCSLSSHTSNNRDLLHAFPYTHACMHNYIYPQAEVQNKVAKIDTISERMKLLEKRLEVSYVHSHPCPRTPSTYG